MEIQRKSNRIRNNGILQLPQNILKVSTPVLQLPWGITSVV